MTGEKKKIALVLPSLVMGGMERVMAELATHFSRKEGVQVYLILLTSQKKFYTLPPEVIIVEPVFDYKKYSRLQFTFKTVFYLRKTIKELKPSALLSFSERYNSFVMIAAAGTGIRTFLSDRASPFYSAGKLIDYMNRFTYRFSKGIIAQTGKAAEMLFNKTKHTNITVIGNPVKAHSAPFAARENIILNVGRFADEKNQHLLAEYFAGIDDKNWSLYFVGDGHRENEVKEKVAVLNTKTDIRFEGRQNNIQNYYQRASIFAFTSTSEGFPNVLAEAMAAGMACISFDCVAGPADLISDGINGFLIPQGNHDLYKEKLRLLMNDRSLRERMGDKAVEKIKQFESSVIADKFFNFLQKG